jgi:hypothetical protein
VDPPAATDALLNGFAGLSEEDRVNVFRTAAYNADDATRQRIRQLAEGDPSPKVNEALKGFDNP